MRLRDTTDFSKITVATLAGFGLGVIAMYVFDPVSGRQRRTQARDKTVGAVNAAADAVQGKVRDLGNRVRGAAAETPGVLQQARRETGGE